MLDLINCFCQTHDTHFDNDFGPSWVQPPVTSDPLLTMTVAETQASEAIPLGVASFAAEYWGERGRLNRYLK